MALSNPMMASFSSVKASRAAAAMASWRKDKAENLARYNAKMVSGMIVDMLLSKGLALHRYDTSTCIDGDHRQLTRNFEYPQKLMILPADMTDLEYNTKSIFGRELLCLLTQDEVPDAVDESEARRLLCISTPQECEVALLRYGAIDWEKFGNSRLDTILTKEDSQRWPMPSTSRLYDGHRDRPFCEMKQALYRVEARFFDWSDKDTADRTIFQGYAASPSAATHHDPYFPDESTSRCRFLELSAELRSRIFDLIIPEPGRSILFPPRSQKAASRPSAGARYAQEPGILLTNKRIRAEALAKFYHAREVYIPVMPLIGPDVMVHNALEHVKDILPVLTNAKIFYRFSWPFNHYKGHHAWKTAIAEVLISGHEFATKIWVEGDPRDRTRDNVEVNTKSGLDNLIEAIEIATPFHLKRVGNVEYVYVHRDVRADATFKDVRCVSAPWWRIVGKPHEIGAWVDGWTGHRVGRDPYDIVW